MCNPWENSAFVTGIENEMPIEECQHCISGKMLICSQSYGVNITNFLQAAFV